MAGLVNRARMTTATTGTGTVTLGSASSNAFLTFDEAGVADAVVVTYVIEEDDDFEIGRGTYTVSGTTLSRTKVLSSKISGVSGTTKMTLAGSAEVFITAASEDMQDADNDTYFDWDTDDVLKLFIGGSQDFTFNANELDVLVGSKITISGDGTAIGAVNAITFGVGDDGSIYSDGTSLTIDAATQIEFEIAGTEVGSWDGGGIVVTSAAPILELKETGATADNLRWRQVVDGEAMGFQLGTDAGEWAASYILVNRTGQTCDSIALTTTALTQSGTLAIGPTAAAAKLHVDQDSTSGAQPVITLEQADVDEDYFKFVGTSDTSADRALVDAANFTTPGAIVGWLKCNVQDDQGSSPIVDGDYYIPFYAVPTA